MSLLAEFHRVTGRRRCPICGRPDWCLISKEGGDDPIVAICARTESPIRAGEAGWIHRLREGGRELAQRRQRWIEIPEAPQDHVREAALFAAAADLDLIAGPLDLPPAALRRLGVGWDGREKCSTWPLWDSEGRCVGIVRRFPEGRKMLRTGDRAGLYMPEDLPHDLAGERILVAEGGTDTAAGLALGRWCIGRFSALSGFKDLGRLLRDRSAARVSIVADRDDVGVKGADALRRFLAPLLREVRVVAPPKGLKDLREWLRSGCTAEDLARAEEAAQ